MKNRFIFTLVMAFMVSSLFAQRKIEMKENLKRDEVPVTVQLSLEKNIHDPMNKGVWQVYYRETTDANFNNARLTPEYYHYSCKRDGRRLEYFFKPDGTIYDPKGTTSSTGTN